MSSCHVSLKSGVDKGTSKGGVCALLLLGDRAGEFEHKADIGDRVCVDELGDIAETKGRSGVGEKLCGEVDIKFGGMHGDWNGINSDDDADLDGFEIEEIEVPPGIPNLRLSKQERKQLWRPWAHALIVTEGRSRVLSEGPWIIAGHYLSVQAWRPEFDPLTDRIRRMVIWVRLPYLSFEYYNRSILTQIGNLFGRTLKINNTTEMANRGKFARLCVEMDISKPLVPKLVIGSRIQNVEYEGLGMICFHCGLIGHREPDCDTKEKSPDHLVNPVPNDKTKNKQIIKSNTFQALEHSVDLMKEQRIDPDEPILENEGDRLILANEGQGKKPQRPLVEATIVLNGSSHSAAALHDVTNLPIIKNLHSDRDRKHFDFGKSTAQSFQGYLDGSQLVAFKDNMVRIASDLKNLAEKDLGSKRKAGIPSSGKYIVPEPPDDILADNHKDVNHMDELASDVPQEGLIGPTNSKESSF
ncbi:hypothetical protein FEM48_Zijuj05G0092000 [Ziziphus jujuba var. spinosa]|uniref:CCHC-type domain-containing protein n=1 Tax=Ziziphus jujuba var. spinosa TaxID=714518 RepID=A0A978VE36_ZIZJJ|nr:hypothetical protein FEM48_Zijuj05G0092000 [Ziziphus jujuba var. spinosa]